MGGPVPPRLFFLWGDQSPHAPPKCAHLGAFHEVVRLGCVVFGLGGRGFGCFFVGGPVPPRLFFVGGPVPPRPPKCAHLGAFHEVVRLECVVFGLGGVRAFFLWGD